MPTNSSDFVFYGLTFKDVLIAVGWLVTIVGWGVSNRAANNREKRKESRAEVDACTKQLGELILKVRDYFTKPANDSQAKLASTTILFELRRLVGRLEILEAKYPQFEVVNACGELFDSVTGDPFDSTERVELLPSSDHMLKIESDVLFLIGQLEMGFYSKFK